MNEPNETEFLPPYEGADAPEAETREEFRIDSENAANWYLRRLANIESEKQRITANAAAIVAQLDADASGLRWKYEGEFQNFVRQELARRGSRRRSLKLLQGTAQFRTVPAGLTISDTVAALDFCRRNLPAAVKVTESLDTAKYRDFAQKMQAEADALPIGVETTPEKESFSVKF